MTHPFDTGDRCFIGAENLVVKRMGIWSTNFVRVDGTEAYYYSQFRMSSLSLAARLSADLALLFFCSRLRPVQHAHHEWYVSPIT